MYHKDVLIKTEQLPDHFASFFSTKGTNLISWAEISKKIYNGTKKVDLVSKMFLEEVSIDERIKSFFVG